MTQEPFTNTVANSLAHTGFVWSSFVERPDSNWQIIVDFWKHFYPHTKLAISIQMKFSRKGHKLLSILYKLKTTLTDLLALLQQEAPTQSSVDSELRQQLEEKEKQHREQLDKLKKLFCVSTLPSPDDCPVPNVSQPLY